MINLETVKALRAIRLPGMARELESQLEDPQHYKGVNGKYFSRKKGIYFSRDAANYFPEFAAFYFPYLELRYVKPVRKCDSVFSSPFTSLGSQHMRNVSPQATGTQGYQTPKVPIAAAIVSRICRRSRPSRQTQWLVSWLPLDMTAQEILGYLYSPQEGDFLIFMFLQIFQSIRTKPFAHNKCPDMKQLPL